MLSLLHRPSSYHLNLAISLTLLASLPSTHSHPLINLQPRSTTSNKPSREVLIGAIIGILAVLFAFLLIGSLALRHRARSRVSKRRAGIHANPAVRWAGAEMYARETSERVKRARRSSPNVNNVGGMSGGLWRVESEGAPPPAYARAAPPSYQAAAFDAQPGTGTR